MIISFMLTMIYPKTYQETKYRSDSGHHRIGSRYFIVSNHQNVVYELMLIKLLLAG